MKILFPFVGDSIGGSHLSSLELYKAIKSVEIEPVILLHIGHGSLSRLLDREGISYRTLSSSSLAGSSPSVLMIAMGILRNLFKFRKFILRNNIDIVHGNDLRVNLSWSIPTKLAGKKFVWHQRTLLSSSYLWKLVPYLCHYFIAISNVVLVSAPTNLHADKKKLVWNPVVADKIYTKWEGREFLYEQYVIPKDQLLVGYVGRLVEYKKLDFLLDSLALFAKSQNIPLHFIIIGDGTEQYQKKIEQQIESIAMQGSVTLTGFVTNPSKLISAFDVLIAASRIDAFGRSLVEAMLQKVPVLAAAAGGHMDAVHDGVTGYLFKPDDSKDFVNKMSQLLIRDNEKLITLAYQKAEEQYSVESHAAVIKSIYYELLSH